MGLHSLPRATSACSAGVGTSPTAGAGTGASEDDEDAEDIEAAYGGLLYALHQPRQHRLHLSHQL
eukprot:CAMPEP_0173221466 /NCGR_PEP_ID=MMETSP1142-20121109/2738_1 /TAXON_ID=483371 /ORGANISM="non described non described, Strain CCMP2298" /LENGTH=64 /DNA_ID=CAMNT_0014149503 /DNA_START=369 /DNA_END=559 /DNA_ORIENTATION=-